MNVRSLLMVGGLGSVFGGVSAVLLLPFAVGQRLNRPGSAGECWVSVATAGLLVVFSTNDPVFLSSCGLLILADLARQQPMVPPESLVAFSLLIGASIHPSDLGSLEAVPLVMVLAGFASKGWPFATRARTICTGILVGLSWGLLVAEVWVHFLPLG